MRKEVILFTSLIILGNIIKTMGFTDRSSAFEECDGKPADIALIIDASRSIHMIDFYKGMEFLWTFVESFRIGPQYSRVAAVTFGEKVITGSAFGFDQFNTKDEVLRALKSIRFIPELGGNTNTAMAIAYARKHFFVNARPNAKKIAIVLTDGRSTNFAKTIKEAELLRSQDVHIVTIGVGPFVMREELEAIASNSESVFEVVSYDAIKSISVGLGFITCKICESQPTDIAFIIDASRSIYEPNFDKGMKFLSTLVNGFQISPNKVRVAALAFGERVITESAFGFDQFNTKDEVLRALKSIKFRPELGGDTKTARAIAFARKHFFVNARPYAQKIAIVLTDGKSSNFDRTKEEAELLRSHAVHIISIGIGPYAFVHELREIASNEDSVHLVSSYDALVDIMNSLVSITCKELYWF